jgi:cytochrome bd-type quinol oxidase subunit 2
LAIVAVGVVITFLSVRVQYHVSDQDLQDVVTSPVHWTYFVDAACGSVWQALFIFSDDKCGSAALPRLWIAAGVAAVGMGLAFWGARRGRLLAAVCLPFAGALSVFIIWMVAMSLMYGGGD